jgi:tetratricopeptide (TPR) repeat protein
MKKVGLGLEKLPVEKLRTYYDLSVEQARNSGASRTSVGSRFWFYPIVNRVNVLRDVVLLEKFEMGVFTEVLYAEVDGKPVADLDRFEHYPSESFSRSFSDNYDAASQAREVLETLRGLTRLAALAKGLTQVDLRLNLGFYITGYLLDKSKTPQEADVLKVENQEVGFEISGGVDLMALVTQIKEGDASALKKLVLRGRSERTDLTWAFGTVLWQDQPADVKLLQRSPDLSAVMSLFQQAVFLEKKLRYAAAIECYSRIIDLEPRLPELYCRRGVAYAHISDYESAITDYDRALSLEANYANAYNNRGIAYRCKGNYDQALADYTKALSINPSDAAVYTNRGVAYQEKKDFDRAIADHNEAIRLDNSLAQAYNNRGTAYYLRGEKERAIADYDRAIALGLSSPEVYVNRGMAYYTTGQYSKAAADLTEAIARNPYDAELYFVSGNAYRKAGNYREAIRDYDKVVAMTPDRAEAYLNRGLAYADGLHDYLRAIRDYDSAISLLESFGSAKKSDLALAYNARGGAYGMAAYLAGDDNYSRSLRDIEKALLLDPQLLEAYFNKAQILEKAHKSTEAMQYYRKYISMAKNGMKLRELNKDYADKLLRQAQEALRELER